jgi:hypothetical protein
LGILLAAHTGQGAGSGSARRGLGANHRTAETCVGATGSSFRLVGRNRPRRSAFHLGHSLPRICVTLPVVGSQVLIAAGCANQTNDRWARPIGARPTQWGGARSYSIHLWLWPVLIILQ